MLPRANPLTALPRLPSIFTGAMVCFNVNHSHLSYADRCKHNHWGERHDQADNNVRIHAAVCDEGTQLGDWQRATLDGNQALSQGDAQAALARYHIALDLADALWGEISDPDTAIATRVVSHHNLAELHVRTKRPDLAAMHFYQAHELLYKINQDASLDPRWREAARRHSGVTHTELLQFLRQHPGHEQAGHAAVLPWQDPADTQH